MTDPITMAIIGAAVGGGAAMAFGGDDKEPEPTAPEPTPVDTGAAKSFESVETQSAQRRLARLSKYFTSPTGVLDAQTGSQGVF